MPIRQSFSLIIGAISFLQMLPLEGRSQQTRIENITQLHGFVADTLVRPESHLELSKLVRNHQGPISIGGGRYSMGGQIGIDSTLFLDMRSFNQILDLDTQRREIRVQAGATWRSIQERIDPHHLSVQIMQTYANFTVGGSLSVNVHGRYIGKGPIVSSVKEIRMVLANGDSIRASREENAELFWGAIGGYGGLGIITEATLWLDRNEKVERSDTLLHLADYSGFFRNSVRNDSSVVFHNADWYPKAYRKVRAVSFRKTDKALTEPDRLHPWKKRYGFNRFAFRVIAGWPGGKWIRQHLIDPILYRKSQVVWRNFEASYDTRELEPRSRKRHTYVLQEYFVPVSKLPDFAPKMAEILRDHKVNVMNVSIRHALPDTGTTLTWAREEVFCFVLYYRQRTRAKDQAEVGIWTQKLIQASLDCGGRYYLPYQIWASPDQFRKAYPGLQVFAALKKKYDPTNKFRNRLWDSYLKTD
jgi:FAD/FMN-containing dehydrogenase